MGSGGNTMNPFFIRQFALAVSLLVSVFAFAAPTSFTVEVSGKGKPIIFIPGLASSGEVWKDTVAQFSGRYECHVITLAGFAGVTPIATPLLSTVQKDLVEYIDAKKLDRPIIVGHSLGGFLALRMGADAPAKVGRLVIVDSLPALGAVQMPDITPDQLKSMAARMRDGMKNQDAATFAESQRRSVASMVTKPDDLERVLGWGRKSDGATVMNAMHDLIATDLRQDIERIKSPTLVLGTWIAYKEYTTRAAVENTFKTQYQKLSGVTIEVADTARHFIMYDDPNWMFERMEKFLK
jgi:pimeloyl-ACP methyl ester carboxylesterase